ncbi:M20/M25/M40 family metallo-hydrolase [Sphingomonas sp. S1-29]|uniref:M20/M25/M40 family metallo-hydrolase n=1 Tax=Sphingomonas sp. S1-29 TaxID=2991074 RepID=UPI00223F10D4|nr:M20/M25/M40 family metallo-hydrolase [Sphingomonas sp. S1-29]UZK68140.1 M20/M25/M40 family metallo-hydrolase [Sphingomonas sp. S1-29]
MIRTGFAVLAAVALGGIAPAQTLPADQAAMKAHVAFLAADSLKGRQAGSPEYDIAADYVIAQMEAAGLAPAGERGGWRQQVPLVASRPLTASATLTRGGRETVLTLGTDFVGRASLTQAERVVSGEMVFAGYGVVDPTRGIDDYRGLDVRGKIVAVMYGGPPGMNSEVAAHYGNRDVKADLAGKRGAAGIVFIESRSTRASYDFAAIVESWSGPSMSWTPPAGSAQVQSAPQLAAISERGAATLFAGSKLAWAKVRAADEASRPLPTGPLTGTIAFRQTSELQQTVSANLVGRLEGSDPALKAQHIVLTAHLDHIGVTDPVNGDSINNGAMDNAMGIAAMLEVAKSFRASGKPPKRSILFVAVTAEEAGLIGSDYFARYPTVPRASLAANVNLDMPIMTYKFEDIVAYGADRSSIGPALGRVAKAQGLTLTPDPTPDEAFFVRTDHYSFVKQGVPSVSIDAGPKGPGAAATAAFIEQHYHQPSDDLKLPFDWDAARRFVRLNYDLTRALADGPKPVWNKGDFFGTLYGGGK